MRKIIGFWNHYASLSTQNFMFLNPNAPIGDDLLLPFNELYLEARRRDIQLTTLDLVGDLRMLDAIVFIDSPYDTMAGLANQVAFGKFGDTIPMYLITFEPPNVRPENWHEMHHTIYRKVFTWNDDLVAKDPDRYVKTFPAQRFPTTMPRNERDHLAVMIASNKTSDHPLDLYHERLRTLEWFEENHPRDLRLYGPGWDGKAHRCYCGVAKSKREELQRHRFSIVYENARDLPGYITEKIHDCFIAGTIPVYWGASNVSRWIPPNCYIDRRAFEHGEDLYRRLVGMTDEERLYKLNEIDGFMQSESARPFTIERFTDTILSTIDVDV